VLGKLPADQNDGRKRYNRQHAKLLHTTYFFAMAKTELGITPNSQKRQTTDPKQKPKPRNKAIQNQCRPEIQSAEGRTEICKTRGRCRTKHLRRSCGRASEPLYPRAAHAAFVAGCAGVAETYKVDVKEQSCLISNIICKPRWRIKDAFGFVLGLPNGLRYPRWGGRRNAVQLEK